MKSPKHIVVYTEKKDSPEFPKSSKLEWANPHYYEQPRHGADAVYAPNRPKIEEDYKVAGKSVWRPSDESARQAPEPAVKPDLKASGDHVKGQVEEVTSEVEEPVDTSTWRDLSWPKMRSLATEFTDEPVKSKDQAKEILEQAESEGKL